MRINFSVFKVWFPQMGIKNSIGSKENPLAKSTAFQTRRPDLGQGGQK
ncbi:hypothetical protein TDIS_1584 [Thermosulfurimonas dismutans]|uniref:Uncharacterized protein n=1 Tax=Thermosulfurimonas dismutans TaxID=999894 RepID=A0A179D3U5_9BACT|nr:hypothetical protein TDIS_1584 [Thermosulfurimonas dismutans]